MVEHHLAKVRVAGSNPVVRSRESPGSGVARDKNPPFVARPELPRTTFAPHFLEFFVVVTDDPHFLHVRVTRLG